MPRVAIIIAASRASSFYSQIATLSAAIGRLQWRRWTPSIHVFFGSDRSTVDLAEWDRWAPHLKGVHVADVSEESFRNKENWAQVDATVEQAPADADAILHLDADTLPVATFEHVLDDVASADLVAGVMAHFPPPGMTGAGDWERLAEGLVRCPVSLTHQYSLIRADAPAAHRQCPFYVNGGVVFYGRSCFDRFAQAYVSLRAMLAGRVADAFSGQVASALAISECGLRTWALPMRYNFPNDTLAEQLHPTEAENVVIHHYLRIDRFDRHRIFATRQAFDEFMAMPLSGPDLRFRDAVRALFQNRYPFD